MQLSLSFIYEYLADILNTELIHPTKASNCFFSYLKFFSEADLISQDPDALYLCNYDCVPRSCLNGTIILKPERCETEPIDTYTISDFPPSIVIKTNLTILDVYNLLESIFRRYSRFENNMYKLLNQTNSIQTVLDSVQTVFNNPCYIIDNTFRILAISKDPEMESFDIWHYQYTNRYLPVDQSLVFMHSKEFQALKKSNKAVIFQPETLHRRNLLIAIRDDSTIHGYFFVVEAFHDLTDIDKELALTVSDLLAMFFKLNPTTPNAINLFYEQFFSQIIDGDYQHNEVNFQNQLRCTGWEKIFCFQLILFDHSICEMQDTMPYIKTILINEMDGKPFIYNEMLICIFELDTQPLDLKKIDYYFSRLSCHIGLSCPFSSLFDLKTPLNQAKAAIDYGFSKKPKSLIHQYDDYYIFDVCKNLKKLMQEQQLWDSSIETLNLHDHSNKSQYVKTLFTFLKNERNITQTAKELSLHRNSLIYRLEKIQTITTLNLENPDVRIRLLLSLYASNPDHLDEE